MAVHTCSAMSAVDLSPLNITEHHGAINGAVDMVGEAKLALGEVEGLTDGEIQLDEIKGGGDMVADTMWTGKIWRICSASYSCMLGTYIHSTNRPRLVFQDHIS